ncbi:DUF2505 domain-containing protein [Schaalia naturae]|uniref:DUF2505 domain-containing protein n=1 Tax=Schaalia naturae TaxID=635203 RepID=A0ABW2SNS8_9ACTO
MHITQSFVYPAPLSRISQMYADPDHLLRRLDRRGILDPSVEANVAEDGTTTVVAAAAGDPSLLPSAARRFVRSGLSARIALVLAPEAGGERRGTVDVTVSGAPVSASARLTLADRGESTEATVELDIRVSVPLVGGAIEQKAAGAIRGALETEPEAAREWLDAHPAA